MELGDEDGIREDGERAADRALQGGDGLRPVTKLLSSRWFARRLTGDYHWMYAEVWCRQLLTCLGERPSRVLRKASQPYHREEGSQGGEYGGSTRRLERRAKSLNISRTSSVLFSSRVMLLCRAHIVSSQRRYFSLSFTGSPARTRVPHLPLRILPYLPKVVHTPPRLPADRIIPATEDAVTSHIVQRVCTVRPILEHSVPRMLLWRRPRRSPASCAWANFSEEGQ